MESRTQVDPLLPTTPSERKAERALRHELPHDLLREASNRLSLAALVGGVQFRREWPFKFNAVGRVLVRPYPPAVSPVLGTL